MEGAEDLYQYVQWKSWNCYMLICVYEKWMLVIIYLLDSMIAETKKKQVEVTKSIRTKKRAYSHTYTWGLEKWWRWGVWSKETHIHS